MITLLTRGLDVALEEVGVGVGVRDKTEDSMNTVEETEEKDDGVLADEVVIIEVDEGGSLVVGAEIGVVEKNAEVEVGGEVVEGEDDAEVEIV